MAGIGASRVFQPEPRRTPPGHDNDPFLNFNSEVPEPPPQPTPPPAPEPPPFLATNLQTLQEQLRAPQKAETQRVGRPQGLAPITIGLCVGLAGIMTAGVLYFQLGRQQASAERPASLVKATVETHGTLSVTSNPEGSRVFVNGKLQGATPLTLSLPVGAHELELRNGSSSRKIPLNIAGGETISQVIDLEPGVPGFVSFKSPVTMRVSEAGHTLGTTAGKISLSPGRHDLELASNSLDFRRQVTVYVNSGQTTTATIDPPEGVVFINATPWANVLIDGKPVGITPLGNLKVPIGEHEITWRHPTFGQRRMTVRVSSKSPLRVSVDYRQ